jgi:lipopolysaccharide transport system ATP-binding protein
MALIEASDVTIDFPIYGANNRSLKTSIVNMATGGILARDASERVLIRAIDNASFTFREGDRIGLIGHNGSGKSTLLRMIAGIYEPVTGSLLVEGRIASMLSITVGIDMEATGMENIFMRGRVMGISARSMEKMLDEIVEFSGIGEYLHLPMRTYSTGMVMRLAFAVATSIEAEIVLMDEWLSVGDAEFVNKARERLHRLVEGAHIVVLASHDIGLIKSQCNRILKLEHGRLTDFIE